MPVLSTIIWTPIVAGTLILLASLIKTKNNILGWLSMPAAILTLGLCLYAVYMFNPAYGQMQFIEQISWMKDLNINYALGWDAFSLLLTVLSAFMTSLVIISASKKPIYCATFLIMQGLISGVFAALDAILFYVFFEAMMIPMFIIIGVWGAENRVYATIKFILYTFFASIFLLVAILYLNKISGTFAIEKFQGLPLSLEQQKILFWGVLLAFAVKIPMWPVHTWLPDAHTEAPTGGSVILAAITLKIGAYGLLRFLLPVVPQACIYFADIVIALSLIAIAYIGLVAIAQRDMKRLIAYSSIAHMGFVTLGLFVACKIVNDQNTIINVAILSVEGAVMQMISHGFVSGALFFCVGVLYYRIHSRLINDYGGVVNTMPIFSAFFMLFALANVGMPGTSGFVGEFLVILASFKLNILYSVIAASTLVLAVAYTLWMYKRVIFGSVSNQGVAILQDLTKTEKMIFILLAAPVLLFGVWPNLLLNIMHNTAANLVSIMAVLK